MKTKGPLIVLPDQRSGGPGHVFRVRWGCFGGIVATIFACGFVVSASVGGYLLRGGHLPFLVDSSELTELESENDRLQQSLDELNAFMTEQDRTLEAGNAPVVRGTREATLPSFTGAPTIRVAISKGRSARLGGTSLYLAGNQRVPLPDQAIVRLVDGQLQIDRLGIVPSGSVVQAGEGNIEVGGKTYSGSVELHLEGTRLIVVNEVDFEEYVTGVVAKELPGSWGQESKSAQAVAARSYALYRQLFASGPYDVESTQADQVYGGMDNIPESTRVAVRRTRGEVLAIDGELVQAFYHATCGGHTETPAKVWSRPSAGLSAVACDACQHSPTWRWNMMLEGRELKDRLREAGYDLTQVRGFEIVERSPEGRISGIVIDTDRSPIRISGEQLRWIIGSGRLKSTWFHAQSVEGGMEITGRGFGHGVGMCQWGINGFEQTGMAYRQILRHYYPETDIIQIYP